MAFPEQMNAGQKMHDECGRAGKRRQLILGASLSVLHSCHELNRPALLCARPMVRTSPWPSNDGASSL